MRHAELVDKRRDEPVPARIERCDQIITALGMVRRLPGLLESVRDLLVEFVAVGDDNNPRVIAMFADPLCKPHHHQRLARSLRMPDNAAFLLLDSRLGGIERENLVRAHNLLHTGIEYDRVVHKPQKTLRLEHLKNRTVQRVLDVGRREHTLRARIPARFFPLEPEFRRSQCRTVFDSFRLAAGNEQLRGRKKSGNLSIALVAPILPHPFLDRDRRLLELNDAEHDAVDVNTHIRTAIWMLAAIRMNPHFFCDRKRIVERILPIDEPDLLHRLAWLRRYRHGIAQHLIHRLVGVVESALRSTMCCLFQLCCDTRDLPRRQPFMLFEKLAQHIRIDVCIVLIFEIPPIRITKL